MVGKNKLVLCQAEMVRAINVYLKDLMIFESSRPVAVQVKQVGAQLQRDFVVDLSAEIESPIDNAQQPK